MQYHSEGECSYGFEFHGSNEEGRVGLPIVLSKTVSHRRPGGTLICFSRMLRNDRVPALFGRYGSKWAMPDLTGGLFFFFFFYRHEYI